MVCSVASDDDGVTSTDYAPPTSGGALKRWTMAEVRCDGYLSTSAFQVSVLTCPSTERFEFPWNVSMADSVSAP